MVVLYVPEECDFGKIRKLLLLIENVNMLFPYVLLLANFAEFQWFVVISIY